MVLKLLRNGQGVIELHVDIKADRLTWNIHKYYFKKIPLIEILIEFSDTFNPSRKNNLF